MSNYHFILTLFCLIRGTFRTGRKRNKGKKHEDLVFAAFKRRRKDKDPWPEAPCIQSVERNPRDYGSGFDATVYMDAGIIAYVQIKSSKKGAEQFKEAQRKRQYPSWIVVVVIDDDNDHLEPEDIRRVIWEAVEPVYRREIKEALVPVAENKFVNFIPAT